MVATTNIFLKKAAYFGYKGLSFRLIVGDDSVLAEVVAALLMVDLGKATLKAAVEATAELAADLFDVAKELNESTRDFKAIRNKPS